MTVFIKKHEWVFFFICTYLLTGLLFAVQSFVFPGFIFPLYLIAPAFTALMTTGIISGKTGVILFLKGLMPKTKAVWIIISVLLPAILILLMDIVYKVSSSQPPDFNLNAGMPVLSIILIALIGSIGEELGWRSYLLPLLSKKYGNLLSAVLVGVMWALWHAGDYGQGLGYLIQIVWLIEMSVVYTWLYYKSGRNSAVPVIYHTVHGISGICAGYAVMDIKSNIAMAVVYAIPALILVFTSSVYKGKPKAV